MARHALHAVLAATLLLVAGCGGTGGGPATTPGAGPGSGDANASTVRGDALDAIESVEEYRVRVNGTVRQSANALSRELRLRSVAVVNRTGRRLGVNQTTTARGQSVRTATYVVNGTLYQHSPQFARVYDATWVKVDLGANASERWEGLDPLSRQRAILAAGAASLAGTATVNGTEAFVLEVRADGAAASDLGRGVGLPEAVNVTAIEFTYWIARDTGRPLRAAGTVNATATVQGQTVTVNQSLTMAFEYVDVAVSLPPGAENAVPASNATAGTGGEASAVARPG